MIKQLLAFSLLLTLGINAQVKKDNKIEKHAASNNTFEKKQLDLNIGFGLGTSGRYYGGSWLRVSPPINASLDYGITESISLGGCLAYVRAKYDFSSNYTYVENNVLKSYSYTDTHTWSYYIIGIRGAFHLAPYMDVENLDLYGGVMLGNSFVKYSYSTNNSGNGRVNTYSSSKYGGPVGAIYVGGRYRFSDKFGVYGEFGYGLAYGNIGLNIKF